jgi:hypothetical protein
MLQGVLQGLEKEYKKDQPVVYNILLGKSRLCLNEYINKELSLLALGPIYCSACGRSIKKTYQGGYCYPCCLSLAQADICMVRPELCHLDKGTCRDSNWARSHCLIPHSIYLAWGSALKVGITRSYRRLSRWMDQGALAAIVLGEVDSRKLAGQIEVYVKEYCAIADKTNWRTMLKSDLTPPSSESLKERREQVVAKIAERFADFRPSGLEPVFFSYPRKFYPDKIKTYNFDKTAQITDTLMGLKGQYLIYSKAVLNLRKFIGYEMRLS